MSTQCNVILKHGRDKLIFYRDTDGNPKGTLPSLKKFMLWVQEGRIRDNLTQSAGWLVLIGAKEWEMEYVDLDRGVQKKLDLTEPSRRDLISGWQCGAYQPTPRPVMIVNYIYTLDLKKMSIMIQSVETFLSHTEFKQNLTTLEIIKDFAPYDDTTTKEPGSEEIKVKKPSRFDYVEMVNTTGL